MAASASELPSVARTIAVPNAMEVTANEMVVCPAGTPITDGAWDRHDVIRGAGQGHHRRADLMWVRPSPSRTRRGRWFAGGA